MPQEQPIYRRAALEDLAVICALGQEVNRLHHEAWPEIFAAPSHPERDAAHWLQSLQGEDAAAFLAERQGVVIGFATVQVVNETHSLMQPVRFARVGSVCVAERERGRGVGKALMAMLERWAISSGAADVRLNVWKFNATALRLYEELGYEVRSLSMGKAVGHDVA